MLKKIISTIENTSKKIANINSHIAGLLLLIIFLAFCINVILRYSIGISFGWIVEFSLIIWLWIIFLGAGTYLKDDDHVSFVYMYRAFGKKISLFLRTISFAFIFIVGIIMIAPVWDYIDFLKIRRSDVIGIPMNMVFLIYKIFLIAIILRYGYKFMLGIYRLKKLYQYQNSHEHTVKLIEKEK